MRKNIEVELKFKILDENEIEKFLQDLKFVKKKSNLDKYLDTENAQLYKNGIFIRIRDNKKFDFKFNKEAIANQNMFSDHSHCDEYSFDIPLSGGILPRVNKVLEMLKLKRIVSPTIDDLKKQNNFIESVIIDKVRKIYKDSDFEYSYDNVKNLGKFLEIETFAKKSDDFNNIKAGMRDGLKGLK